MLYTPTQEKTAITFCHGCEDYIYQLIQLESGNYANSAELARHPEEMDEFLNLYRVKDMCFNFLIDHTSRIAGHFLEELDNNQIDKFFKTYDPIDLANFFNQKYILDDFIQANELLNPNKNSFNNDDQYQTDYQNLIANL